MSFIVFYYVAKGPQKLFEFAYVILYLANHVFNDNAYAEKIHCAVWVW